MAKPAPAMPKTAATEWDRDAALTTARMLLEIEAINFRPEEPFTFTSGWKSPVYIDCRRIIYFPRVRSKICELAVEKIHRHVGYETIEAVAGGETAGIPFAAWIADRMARADGLCPQEAQGVRPQCADRGRRAGGQAHAAGGGPDHRRPVEDPLRQVRCATPARSSTTHSSCSSTACFPARSKLWRGWISRCTICARGGTCWRPATTGPYFSEAALSEVRRFLEDPVAWSAAHGGISSAEEAAARRAAAEG